MWNAARASVDTALRSTWVKFQFRVDCPFKQACKDSKAESTCPPVVVGEPKAYVYLFAVKHVASYLPR